MLLPLRGSFWIGSSQSSFIIVIQISSNPTSRNHSLTPYSYVIPFMTSFKCDFFKAVIIMESSWLLSCFEEINEGQANKKRKGYLLRVFYGKDVSHHHLCLAETRRQREKWESFKMEKCKGLRCDQIGVCWSHLKPCIRSDGSIFVFFWLVLSWK